MSFDVFLTWKKISNSQNFSVVPVVFRPPEFCGRGSVNGSRGLLSVNLRSSTIRRTKFNQTHSPRQNRKRLKNKANSAVTLYPSVKITPIIQ